MAKTYVAQRQFVSPVFGHVSQGQEIVIDEDSAGISQLVAIDHLVDLGDLAQTMDPPPESVTEPTNEPTDGTDKGDESGDDVGKSDPGPTNTPTNPGPAENK